jgi:hypothetical protein
MKRFLNKFELETLYGFKIDFQAKYRSQKKIPYIKIGGIVKYDRVEIDKWIEAHAVVCFEAKS